MLKSKSERHDNQSSDEMKTRMKAILAILAVIGGMACAGTGGSLSLTASLNDPPMGVSLSCVPQTFAMNYSPTQLTSTTCTAIANKSGYNVTFSTNSLTGSFSNGGAFASTVNCTTTLPSNSCAVTYQDTASGNPTVTALFSGDGLLYGASSITNTLNVMPLVCALSLTSSGIDLSSGNIASIGLNDTGNIGSTVTISGSDWDYGTGTVGYTLWDTVSPPTIALTYSSNPLVGTFSLTNSTGGIPLYFSATTPLGTPAGSHTQTITLSSAC